MKSFTNADFEQSRRNYCIRNEATYKGHKRHKGYRLLSLASAFLAFDKPSFTVS